MVLYRVDQSRMPRNVNVKQKLTGFLDFVSSPVCHVPVSRSKMSRDRHWPGLCDRSCDRLCHRSCDKYQKWPMDRYLVCHVIGQIIPFIFKLVKIEIYNFIFDNVVFQPPEIWIYRDPQIRSNFWNDHNLGPKLSRNMDKVFLFRHHNFPQKVYFRGLWSTLSKKVPVWTTLSKTNIFIGQPIGDT